jgi:hypothetical protein
VARRPLRIRLNGLHRFVVTRWRVLLLPG